MEPGCWIGLQEHVGEDLLLCWYLRRYGCGVVSILCIYYRSLRLYGIRTPCLVTDTRRDYHKFDIGFTGYGKTQPVSAQASCICISMSFPAVKRIVDNYVQYIWIHDSANT